MLSDPVAEAFGLIHRHPSGENFGSSLEIDGENLLYFDVNLSLLPTEKDYSPYV